MSSDAILQVDNLSTCFSRSSRRAMVYGLADIAADILPGFLASKRVRGHEFEAVKGLSFTVRRGEAVAICGRNGAGKTTILRTIAGLLKPSEGSVTLSGKCNSIIELGRGLIHRLTGRENARLSLAWHGIGIQKIDEIVDQVNGFAELGDMFEQPVGTYSTGMRSRLAFAIAVHNPSDLILVDEVLSVGDLRFQHKCFAYMKSYLDSGGSLLLVSHDIQQMQTVCRRGLLIEHGQLAFDGPMEECAARLIALQELEVANRAQSLPNFDRMEPDDSTSSTYDEPMIGIQEVVLLNEAGATGLLRGDNLEVEIKYHSDRRCDAILVCQIWTNDGSVCISIQAHPGNLQLEPGCGTRVCRFKNLPLMPGRYQVQAHLADAELFRPFSRACTDKNVRFEVLDLTRSRTDFLRRHTGELIHIDADWRDEGCKSPTKVGVENVGHFSTGALNVE